MMSDLDDVRYYRKY